ncbi:unnamed protein product [Pleuronectes platessa]|uniref:Uncharacterized protein n=1 Tax=Pleuronectes platessa TaxID=8262 RepID=A0A9N7V326_PLEPL|nr:unnamed protein product [Pleuronectes platessa]
MRARHRVRDVRLETSSGLGTVSQSLRDMSLLVGGYPFHEGAEWRLAWSAGTGARADVGATPSPECSIASSLQPGHIALSPPVSLMASLAPVRRCFAVHIHSVAPLHRAGVARPCLTRGRPGSQFGVNGSGPKLGTMARVVLREEEKGERRLFEGGLRIERSHRADSLLQDVKCYTALPTLLHRDVSPSLAG